MTKVIEEETRRQISKFLPAAISKTLISYQSFTEQSNLEDEQQPKTFSDHHSACKAAISHLELLLKLARWADVPHTGEGQDSALTAMLLAAQERVENYKQNEE